MNKLSLKRSANTPPTVKTPSSDMPSRERTTHRAYKDLGQVIRFLKKAGFKVKWHKPLSKKIYDQIRAVLPSEVLSSRKLYEAIGRHVHSVRYLMRLKDGDSRFNIYGKREGKVSPADEADALKQLIQHHPRFMTWKRKSKNRIIEAKKPQRGGNRGK